MNAAGKLGVFAAVVAATFAGAMTVGAAVGPIGVGDGGSHGGHAAPAAADAPARGLAVADGGYRLVVESPADTPPTLAAGSAGTLAFRIDGPDGEPVTRYDQLHERALHLIVVSRNLVDYLHLHPALAADGQWSTPLPALTPGSYRVIADFQPTGAANLTLATDLGVPGDVASVALPAPASTVTVDGYAVTMRGSPAVGDAPLTFEVARDGAAVRTDPYLGAAGHLVAIRAADLAYLHVHPHEASADPGVTFTSEFPTPGTYRLFFEFSSGGAVHVAAFTAEIPDGSVHSPSMHD